MHIHEKTITLGFNTILSTELDDRGLFGVHIWVEQNLTRGICVFIDRYRKEEGSNIPDLPPV